MSQFKNEYPTVFDDSGKLKGHEVHLHLKDNAKPIAQKPREIIFHLRKQTQNKLKELEENMYCKVYIDTPKTWTY